MIDNGNYLVSDTGLCYSNKMKRFIGSVNNGYIITTLGSIHKLVYETFIGPIPEGYDVHHINHNRQDNRLENLCLIEHKKHSKIHIEEHKEKTINSTTKKCSKPVCQYTKDGQFISEYPSAREASRQTGISQGNISNCCKGGKYGFKTAGGCIWKYKEVA